MAVLDYPVTLIVPYGGAAPGGPAQNAEGLLPTFPELLRVIFRNPLLLQSYFFLSLFGVGTHKSNRQLVILNGSLTSEHPG